MHITTTIAQAMREAHRRGLSVIVAESGSIKTHAFRVAMKPLTDARNHALAEYQSKRAEYEAERLKYKTHRNAWNKNPTDEPPHELVEPRPARYMVSDTTLETLAGVFKRNPRGFLLACDELFVCLSSFDKYATRGKGGGYAAAWLREEIEVGRLPGLKAGRAVLVYVPTVDVKLPEWAAEGEEVARE